MFHQSTIAERILDNGGNQRYDNFRYLRSTSMRSWAENGVSHGCIPMVHSRRNVSAGMNSLEVEAKIRDVSCAWFACVDTDASDAPDGVHQVSREQNVSIDINADTPKP